MTRAHTRRLRPALALALLLLATAALSTSALAQTISVQGVLRTAGGGLVPDGDYGMTVSFYDAPDAAAPLYDDVSPAVKVAGGVFEFAVGSVKPLDVAIFEEGKAAFVGVKVGADPELPRQPLQHVAYAIRAEAAVSAVSAGVAGDLACSACVELAELDPAVFAPYAKTADLAPVALSGSYADLQGGPDLSVYAPKANLAAVATTGSFNDLSDQPDLSPYATKAELAPVATTGLYANLAGTPTLAQIGKSCGSGLVVTGIGVDGLLECGPDATDDPTKVAKTGDTMSGDLDMAGQRVRNARGMSYTVWGTQSCADGDALLYKGWVASVYGEGGNSDALCLDEDATGSYWNNWSSGFVTRLNGQANSSNRAQYSNGSDFKCAVCRGTTFTRWGSATCPSGTTKVYDGWVSTMAAGWGNGWATGALMCLHSSAGGNWANWDQSMMVRANGGGNSGTRVQYNNGSDFKCAVCY